MLSVIVPTLNEADGIQAQLASLEPLRRRGHEVIVADGGSADGTAELALALADKVIHAAPGRAVQMNAGAAVARGEVLLFLHADTRLPAQADALVLQVLAISGKAWGRFDVSIEGRSLWFPLIAWAMNRRSRLTGIATGDQALFVKRAVFAQVGGFPAIALMEDIALSGRLKHLGRPVCLHERVITSGRRWERHGVFRTLLTMWRLRLAFFFGADPARLAREYGYVPRER